MVAPLRIHGRFVTLRDWTLADLSPYAAWHTPGQEWQQLSGPYYPQPTPEELATKLQRVRARVEESRWAVPRLVLPVVDVTHDQLIGEVSRYWQSEETDWLSVGIVIFDPENRRQGYGYEALGLWSDYLFRELPNIPRLDMRTWSGNRGMMRLAEKLGYVQEACFRRARIVDGEYFDGLGYGVLREEWEERFPGGFSL